MEPIWLWDAYLDKNWGIFILCIIYGILYLDGYKEHKNKLEETI